MSAGYRDSSSVCPSCLGELVPRETSVESVIDVCVQCEGIWVDWFDGDLPALVGEGRPSKAAPTEKGRSDEGPGLARGCPRCRRPLVEEAYLGDGPTILRCGDCAGAFVPRASVMSLVYYQPGERVRDPEAAKDGFLGRLVDRLRAALGIS